MMLQKQVLRPERRFCGGSAPRRAVPVLRCTPPSEQATTTAPTGGAPAAPADVKYDQTLSSLDSLLGVPAQPPAKASAPKASTSSSSSSGINWAPPKAAATAPAGGARAAAKAKQTFESVMNFEGYAPEIINGRAAMLGFVFALVGELATGESVFAQLLSGGAGLALLVILAVSLASFAPAVRQVPFDEMFGKGKKPAEFGPFKPQIEMINGRAAMIGLAALLLLEGANPHGFFL